MSKYGHRTMNWFEAIVNKIGGEEAGDAFLRDELVVSKPVRVWKTWKTIRLGTFKNTGEIRKALKAGGYFIGDWANGILGKPAFTVSETEQDVKLVNVSVRELGLKQGSCYADICKCANDLGLDLCPIEVGYQLRLQYNDQPKGTRVVVAVGAIAGSVGNFDVFRVEHGSDGALYLDACFGSMAVSRCSNVRFLFQCRK